MQTETLPPTRWRNLPMQRKPAAFVDVGTGCGIAHDGQTVRFRSNVGLCEIVDALPVETELAYLCGPLPGSEQPRSPGVAGPLDERYSPFSAWVLESVAQPQELGRGADRADFLARVPRSGGLPTVAVRTIACWLGTNDATPEEATSALLLVERTIQRQPGWEKAALWATPSGTGHDLWRRSIPIDRATGRSHEYEHLPQELRDLIHRTSGQGNFTYLPARAPELLGNPAMYNLDMRLAYAAAAQEELGCAPATHDSRADYMGFTPARYRVQYRVPDGWAHVGLLMTPDPRRAPDGKRHWHFPNTPGFVGETWADVTELRVAQWPFPHTCPTCRTGYRSNDLSKQPPCPEHGWPITIMERIVFSKGAPLKAWAAKLVQLRDEVTTTAPTPRIAELARAAVRNILLHAIGAFHGPSGQTVTESSHSSADVPDRMPFEIVPTEDGEEFTWQTERRRWTSLDYNRPELSSQIWGRTRAALLLHREVHKGQNPTYTGALTLPYEQIIALRLDSLLVLEDPHWHDDDKVGRFRLKGTYPGPIPWPQSEEDLSQLTEVPHV